MRLLSAAALALGTSLVSADSVGPPLGPVDDSIVAEEPCDPKAALGTAGPLVAPYMCQIGLDGDWFQPYPCEVIKSTSREVYLRFAKWNVPCEIVGTVNKKSLSFSGSMMCNVQSGPPDMIGNDALIERGKLTPIAGGFRIDKKAIELVAEFASGPDDARKVRTEVSRPALAFNVCRRAWPKGFVSDNERAAAMRRGK